MKLIIVVLFFTLTFTLLVAQNENYEFLFSKPAYNKVKTISKEAAAADLDELGKLISDRHSYIYSVDLDHLKVIEKMKEHLPDDVPLSVLAIQIRKLILLLGDSHARVGGYKELLKQEFIPARFGFKNDRLFIYKQDKSGLIDKNHPYVHSIDGIPIKKWQDKAIEISVGYLASKAYRWSRSATILPFIGYLRNDLNLPDADSVKISLESEEEESYVNITLPINGKAPVREKAFGLGKESHFLPGNIGYLRIYSQSGKDKEIIDIIKEWMSRFRNTEALIIDARQCGGGRRTNLKTLFPYFMKPDEKPYIANVAKLRIPANEENFDPRGKLNVGDKKLIYPTEKDASEAELEQLNVFLKTFKPQFDPPQDKFTDWYYYAMNPEKDKYYYDKPVYLLMDWGCGSAGDIFVSVFKGWRNITLVGTPSSGMSGNSLIFNLKNSNIPVRLSTMASFQKTGEKYDGVGIEPDIYMEPEITDWLEQSDTILDRVFKICLDKISGDKRQSRL